MTDTVLLETAKDPVPLQEQSGPIGPSSCTSRKLPHTDATLRCDCSRSSRSSEQDHKSPRVFDRPFTTLHAATESTDPFCASPNQDSDFDRPTKLDLYQALLHCQQLLQLLLARDLWMIRYTAVTYKEGAARTCAYARPSCLEQGRY